VALLHGSVNSFVEMDLLAETASLVLEEMAEDVGDAVLVQDDLSVQAASS